MKTIKLFQASMLLVMTLIAAGCTNDEAKTEQQGTNGTPAGTTVFSGETNPSTTTRTAIVDHTQGAGAKVNWAATDQVWVKDDASTWQQSGVATFPVAANKAQAMFALNGTYTGATHDVIYTNIAITGTPQVEIKAAQTQTTPNNFDHAGEAGDLGVATANRQGDGNAYKFTLNHKSSYLCFLPRCMNVDLGKNIYLTKVTITADKPIAGTFNISGGSITGNAPVANSSNTITLTTNNFPMNTTVADVTKNAAYMVIAPGTYNFTIGYTIKDPTTNVEGTITKTLTAFTCGEGKIHDITANLTPTDYPGHHYFMWDAQQNYWAGHEWNSANHHQPTLLSGYNSNFPTSADPNRWYNPVYYGNGVSTPAGTAFFSTLPNINELIWYIMQGQPHWDATQLWSIMGHLYQGGMWFKKRANIPGFSSTQYGGVDYRATFYGFVNASVKARPANIDEFFFLPALGYYWQGHFNFLGEGGDYWSSSAYPYNPNCAYDMFFNKDGAEVSNFNERLFGFYAGYGLFK